MMRFRKSGRAYARMKGTSGGGKGRQDNVEEGDYNSCEDGDIYSLIGSTIVAKPRQRQSLASTASATATATATMATTKSTKSSPPQSSSSSSLTTKPRSGSYLRDLLGGSSAAVPLSIPVDNSSSRSDSSTSDRFSCVVPISAAASGVDTQDQGQAAAGPLNKASRALCEHIADRILECDRLLQANEHDACIAKCRACLRLLETRWGRYSLAYSEAYHCLGRALYQNQNYDEALVAFRTANRIDEYLALSLQSNGDRPQAEAVSDADASAEDVLAPLPSRQGRGKDLRRRPRQKQRNPSRRLSSDSDDDENENENRNTDDELSTTSSITNVFAETFASKSSVRPSAPSSPDTALNPQYTLREDLTKAVLLLRSTSAADPSTSDRIDRHVQSHRRHLQQSVRAEHHGDALRTRGHFKGAVQKYCKAISLEESAFGGTIGLDLAVLWRKLACVVNLRGNVTHGADDFWSADLIQPEASTARIDSVSETPSVEWTEAVRYRMPERVRLSIQTADRYYIQSHYRAAIAEYRKATIVGRYYYCEQFHRPQPVRTLSLLSSKISLETPIKIPWYFKGALFVSLIVNLTLVLLLKYEVHVDELSAVQWAFSFFTKLGHKDIGLVSLAILLIFSLLSREK